MRVVLVSTYDLGHQPFGLASPAAWLRERGHEVTCVDLALNPLPSLVIREADVVAFHLPMHTATRLAVDVLDRVKRLNGKARLLAYGLYAPHSRNYLRSLGVEEVIGGEFEEGLAALVEGRTAQGLVVLDRLEFRTPDRTGMPALSRYSRLHVNGDVRTVGHTEASRGCKHLCRHCPVVPVYQGSFRVVPPEVVLGDVRQQVAAGAEHITFGDPDFFNGPGHASRIVTALHAEFPNLTYDATIKVEHLLRHADLLPLLRKTGCLFVTSAVESVDDAILEKLDKGHTRADFEAVVGRMREAGLTLSPTFVPFTPWTTLEGYRETLRSVVALELVEAVAPVQLALRLLIPPGSRLLELEDIQGLGTRFDAPALLHRWTHRDPRMDELAADVLRQVAAEQKKKRGRAEVFASIWKLAGMKEELDLVARAAIPYMDEPWYC